MRTALYSRHVALGAKMVEFCGWEMPLQYQGIIPEHLAVRENVGIFDVSHMGRVQVKGQDAERFLDYLSTNKIEGKKNFSATYTVWSFPEGGAVDDVIVYKQTPQLCFVVVNAANREKDLLHLKNQQNLFDVEIVDCFSDGILAIQGPKAEPLIAKLFSQASDIKPMHFLPLYYEHTEIILSRTGYTGSGGFEIYAPSNVIMTLWDRLLKEGTEFHLQPVGLGARDTLRLEMGYALYGHELSETIFANESVSAWTIKWDKKDFLGKEALEKREQAADKRSEYGIILVDKGIAREGYEVFKEGNLIGKVTSGTFSPSLNQAIAIILVQPPLQVGDVVEVQIRTQLVKAQVVKLPFYIPKE